MFDLQGTKRYWNYIPIIFSIFLGFVAGFILTFGVKYCNVFEFISNENARFTFVLFGMGMLGATIYCASFWAVDIDDAIERPQFLPNFFDFFGYITLIIGGGITGIILYLLVLLGDKAVFIGTPKMRSEAAILISFCGGLFHFRVRKALDEFIKVILKQRENHYEDKKLKEN